MGKKTTICGLLILWIVATGVETYAHGGHSKTKKEEQKLESAVPAGDAGNFYSVDGGEAEEDSSPFSRTRRFSGDAEPMRMEPGMDQPQAMEHTRHQVKLAEHQWITPSQQKGYGAAVGITVLAGLAFGMLSIKRKRE